MIINLSKVDFGGVATGGGNAKPEEVFDVQPTTADQTITPTEGSVFSGGTVRAVTAEIDVNIVSNNIKEGVSILGVAGTLKEEKPEESFDVQPTTAEQTITPTEGSVFSGGTVHAVTSSIDSNIQPENIKEGVSILGVAGTLSGGSDVFVVPPEMRFGYSKFTEIPSNWDFREFSNVADMEGLFYDCSNLTAVPPIDTSKATNVSSLFSGCSSLKTVPPLVLSSATNAKNLFSRCSSLTVVPQLDLSSVTNASYLFYNCSSLTVVPQLDLSSVTDASSLLSGCSNLTAIPQMNTSHAYSMGWLFSSCENLTTVEGIDFSGLTSNLTNLFGYDSNKSNLTRFIVNGKINVSISDSYSIKALTAIDYDSVKSILAAADRTDNTNAKELAFNRTIADQNGELAALVSSCTTKGWTITGLTLQ